MNSLTPVWRRVTVIGASTGLALTLTTVAAHAATSEDEATKIATILETAASPLSSIKRWVNLSS